MNVKLAAVVFFLVLASVSPVLAAPDPAGTWRTTEDNAVVRIDVCGDALCGRLLTSDRLASHPDQTDEQNQNTSLRSRLLKGLLILNGLRGGPTEWSGGMLYNPADGRTYHGSIRLVDADTLKLTGCVFYPLCLTKTWKRVK